MNNKTILLEEYVEYVDLSLRQHALFVDTTTKQNMYLKIYTVLFAIVVSLFFFLLFIYLNEKCFFFRTYV